MPTLPPIVPDRTTSGIALNPRTLERVVPETKRSDGSVRKELKIRPGFTPQEDVGRFRSQRQVQSDAIALPKGHILGWVAPSASSAKGGKSPVTVDKVDAHGVPLSKAALKNAKRKAKKAAEGTAGGSVAGEGGRFGGVGGDDEEEEPAGKEKDVPDSWDEGDDAEASLPETSSSAGGRGRQTIAADTAGTGIDDVAQQLQKLAVSVPAAAK